MPLRIGVDATALDEGPISTQTVRRGLVQGLEELDSEHDIVLFRLARHRSSGPKSSFEERFVAKVPTNQLTNVTVLPRAASAARVDVMLYDSFSPPRANHVIVNFTHDAMEMRRSEWFTWRERAYLRPRRWWTRRADWVITSSAYELDLLKSSGLASDRSGTAPLAPEHRFKPIDEQDSTLIDAVRSDYGLPERFVLYLGRANVRKNLRNLVLSLHRSQEVTPECPLVVAGPRDGSSVDVDALAVELGVADRVRYLGAVRAEHVAGLVAAASVFVYISLDEGFGLPPLEAMASGVPVVVSDCGALPEVCGDAARYVAAHDPVDIAAGLDEVLGRPAVHDDLRDRGLRNVRRFSWRRHASDVLDQIEIAASLDPNQRRRRPS